MIRRVAASLTGGGKRCKGARLQKPPMRMVRMYLPLCAAARPGAKSCCASLTLDAPEFAIAMQLILAEGASREWLAPLYQPARP